MTKEMCLNTPGQDGLRIGKFQFYKVGSNRIASEARPNYSGPRNAILAIGIPHSPDRSIRVAFAPLASSAVYHADLEAIVSPDGINPYWIVKAHLRSVTAGDKNTHHVLEILRLSPEDVRRMENIGSEYHDPLRVLNEGHLRSLCSALDAERYEVIKDTRSGTAIQTAIAKVKAGRPVGGIEHLRFIQKTTSGD